MKWQIVTDYLSTNLSRFKIEWGQFILVLSVEHIKCWKFYLYFSKMKLQCILYNQEWNKKYAKLEEVPKNIYI